MPHTIKRIPRISLSKLESYEGPSGELAIVTGNNTICMQTGGGACNL